MNIFGFKKKISQESLKLLEEALYKSDVGVETTQKIMKALQEKMSCSSSLSFEEVKTIFYEIALPKLIALEKKAITSSHPSVIFLVGVNGVGKTTTLAKLAFLFNQEHKKVLCIAADTFRAAAQEQLDQWVQKLNIELFLGKMGMDPSALLFDGMVQAKAKGIDIILCDTAGRLQTKKPLMDELKKMKRTVQKVLPEIAPEIWMVIDATTGHNVLSQCQEFHETLGLTGLIITKLDSSARGGMVLTLADTISVPIVYLGIGEKSKDLIPFQAKVFLDMLFEKANAEKYPQE